MFMQHDKKQLEVLLIQYFKESYSDFPKGLVTASESPDFIVSFKNRHLLGIELTRLNPGNAALPDEDEIKLNELRENLISQAKELFEQKSNHKLFVKFLFSEENIIAEERQMITAVQLANIIRNAVLNVNEDSFFKTSVSANQLPNGLDDLLIINYPALKTSVWERSNNLGVSNNVVDDIRMSIQKKDEKLRLYQKQRLNYYWLLIFTDRLRGVKNFNLHNKIVNHTFHSRFQHVFLFDLIKSDIYELI